MSKERNKAIPAVYLILEQDGKILLARRCNTGYQDGNYQVPAGHVEDGELPKAAMIREAKEEIGIEISEADLELVHMSYRPKHDETGHRVDFFFKATQWSGDIINAEPHKCDELRWVRPNELPSNTTLHVRIAIQEMLQGGNYSEISKDVLKQNGLYMLDG